MTIQKKQKLAALRKKRVRGSITGTSERPRLTVYRSNKYTYVQVIDDSKGEVVAVANELQLNKAGKKKLTGTKTEKAQQIAHSIVDQLKKKKVTQLCFDRGSYRFHGRVKAIAEVVRESGIEV